jgi:hypothetical protein
MIPESLKGTDAVQQNSFSEKFSYLENGSPEDISRFEYLDVDMEKGKTLIDETEVVNSIKDAWKELEGLGNKLSDIKAQLLSKPGTNKENLLAKIRKEDDGIECKLKFC